MLFCFSRLRGLFCDRACLITLFNCRQGKAALSKHHVRRVLKLMHKRVSAMFVVLPVQTKQIIENGH